MPPFRLKHLPLDTLREHEMINLSKLRFILRDGFETATYTAYGKVAAYESHQSRAGCSIGKISYEEFIYYLTGKSEDEARHAPPSAISDTHTTESFQPLPRGVYVGTYHTHPSSDVPEEPSGPDVDFAAATKVPVYIITPSGTVIKLSPSGARAPLSRQPPQRCK